MLRPYSDRLRTRLVRSLVFATFLLVLGILLLALPTAEPVFAASVGIDQCANGVAGTNPQSCSWTTGIVGNSNSSYIEGMASPQRFLLSNLYSGSAGSQCNNTTRVCNLTFSASWTDGTKHGYDMLVSWDQAVVINKQIAGVSNFYLNPCAGYNPGDTATCTDVYTTNQNIYNVPLPDDSFVSGSFQVDGSTQSRINAFEGLYGDRQLRIYANQPITSAVMLLSHCTNNLSSCGIANGSDTSGQTVISYTLIYTTNATDALVTFAGHFALSGNPRINPLTWGYSNGSGAIGGASWHVKDPKLNYTGGSQDNQAQLFEGSAYPIDSGTRAGGGTVTSGAITDTVWMTNTAAGASDIVGNVHFYVCADTIVPFSPPLSSTLPYGCLTTTSGAGYTVTDIGTKTLNVVNAGNKKNSSVTSAVYTPTFAGRYCFLTVFTPTDAIPYNYNVMSDTNSTSECFEYNNPTPLGVYSLSASSGTDWTMMVVAFGLLGIVVSVGVLKFGWRRN
ncbi:MAG: hypothetical protein HY868_16060 [Chloroflexi bacterium]|nr:hypothetical protein [Chloroflexota bacterium]